MMMMEEHKKASISKKTYFKVAPIIGNYLRNTNTPIRFKKKCILFAVGGRNKSITLFFNSLEEMGYFHGHKKDISCLEPLQNTLLASGSQDNTIKL